jgi:uncharacterized membrane protein YfcA
VLISFLCGVLPGLMFGLIGVGSGIIAILLFSNVLNISIHMALPLALLLTFVAALYTVSRNLKGMTIPRSGLFVIIIASVLTSPISVYLSEFINSGVLKKIFYLFMIFASFLIWPSKYEKSEKEAYMTKKRYVALALIGSVAAILNALLGVSGGIIIVPLLTHIGFSVNKSIVTSAYVVLFTTVTSLASYFYAREDVLNFFYKEHLLVLILVFGCIVGSILGNKLAYKLPSVVLKKIFAILVLLVSISSVLSQ